MRASRILVFNRKLNMNKLNLTAHNFKGLLDEFILMNIAICADGTTLYYKFDKAYYMWQQLELSSELEPNLHDTVDWGRKRLVGFNAGKSQLVLFDQSNNTGTIDLKMDGSVLEEKLSFKMLRLSFSCGLDWALTLSLLLKLPPRKVVYFGRCLSEQAQRVSLPYS